MEESFKKRILVVDDDPTVLVLVSKVLENLGYETAEASNGKEALSFIKENIVHLVILDQMMPKMDGIKTCALIKSDKRFRHIPVIIFTASAEEHDRRMSQQVGADAYCNKPLNVSTLTQKIRELLPA